MHFKPGEYVQNDVYVNNFTGQLHTYILQYFGNGFYAAAGPYGGYLETMFGGAGGGSPSIAR